MRYASGEETKATKGGHIHTKARKRSRWFGFAHITITYGLREKGQEQRGKGYNTVESSGPIFPMVLQCTTDAL